MRKRKRLCGVLIMIMALILMTLPVSEADAASSASDFVMEGNILVKYKGTEKDVSVPDDVKVIGESAFENNTVLERVVLPKSVEKIEPYAFWGCDNLATVVLGKGLTTVGDFAFTGCKGLKEMTIPSKVTIIGIQAFADCVNMTDITIPKETTVIHETAFDGCAKLKIHYEQGSIAHGYAVDFYEKQKEMPEYEDVAGYGDGQDTAVTPQPLPTDAPTATQPPYVVDGQVLGSTHIVGNQAVFFMDAGAMKSRQEQVLQQSDMDTASGIAKYTVVDGKVVADQAYYKDNSLGKLSLPAGVAEIGQFAFARSSLSGIGIPTGVTTISYGAFYHCDALAEVELPDTIQNVEPKAFAYSSWVTDFLAGSGEDFLVSGGVLVAYRGNAKKVTVPEGVRVIAAEAFQGHTEMESLVLPDSMRVIGEAAFEACLGLRRVQLNDGLEEIKDRAFCGTSVEKLTVPATVKMVGLRALEGISAQYAGETPKQSYETSATRLSNEVYRNPGRVSRNEVPGVTVFIRESAGDSEDAPRSQMEGASAVLEGASRHYDLTFTKMTDKDAVENAWKRAFSQQLPKDMVCYDVMLTDSSRVPISKLGRQMLTVTVPVPENLLGQQLRAVALDRNGQLERIEISKGLQDGKEVLRMQTYQVSPIGIYGVGADAGGLQELSVSVQAAAAPYGEQIEQNRISLRTVQKPVGIVLFFAGAALLFAGRRKKNRT